MSRPADTVEKISDYLWWLLPGFLKKKDRQASLIGKLCDIWGEVFDDIRSALASVPEMMLIEHATGEYLIELGRERQTYPIDGEDEEDFRLRVMLAYLTKKKEGTIPGMEEGLEAKGFSALVWNPRVLSVGIAEPPADPDKRDAYILSWLVPGTWDDWASGDTPLGLDEGQLDDMVGEPTGIFEGHAGQLAMYTGESWVFLKPYTGLIMFNKADGLLYRFNGVTWQVHDGAFPWSHFLLQVLQWDDDLQQQVLDTIVRRLKPGHTRPVIVGDIDRATWDDWDDGDEPLRLDEGYLDGFAEGYSKSLQDGLLLGYSLEDGADNRVVVDRTGTYNAETQMYNTSVYSAAGRVGKGFDFANNWNRRILANAHIDMLTAQSKGSWAWWFKSTSSNHTGFFSLEDAALTCRWGCLASAINGEARFYRWKDGGHHVPALFGSTNIMDGQWHHIAVTCDETGTKLYVDGEIDAQDEYTLWFDQVAGIATEVNIGGWAAYRCPGLMDEIFLWSRALTQAEIQYVYNNGIGLIF